MTTLTAYYDVAQAAKRLKLHPGSFLRALRRGTLDLTTYEAADVRTHRKYWFLKDAIDALAVKRNTVRRVR